jgi:hypothetical protein
VNEDGPEPAEDPVEDPGAAPVPASPSDDAAGPSRRTGPVVALAVVVGLVAVVAVVGLVVWLSGRDGGDDTITGAEAADALVEAYTRSLDATYKIEGEFTRTLPGGRTLQSAYLSVQRPPDRLQRSLGSTSGVVNGRSINCSTPAGSSYTCAATGEAEPWDEERQEILDALDQYVRGDDPVYAVTGDGAGCFDLARRRTEEDASFGRRAQLCFDETYGGYSRLEVEREGGAVDVMSKLVITDQVSAADFDLDAYATYDPVVADDPATTSPTTS